MQRKIATPENGILDFIEALREFSIRVAFVHDDSGESQVLLVGIVRAPHVLMATFVYEKSVQISMLLSEGERYTTNPLVKHQLTGTLVLTKLS